MGSNFRTLDDMPLMSKAEIASRLRGHTIAGHGGARREMTLSDIAKWCECSLSLLKRVAYGLMPLHDKRQIRLTQFYALLDAGKLEFVIRGKIRAVVRVEPDPLKPRRLPPVKNPRIEFTASGPKVRFG